MKMALWIGTPSLITFLASVNTQVLDNIDFFFLLSAGALLVAILPRLNEVRVRK